jgi:hypothetical protein
MFKILIMVEETPKEEVRACATPDCPNPASMQCPTCVKLELTPTYFCGQECFTGYWKFHKMAHKKKEVIPAYD